MNEICPFGLWLQKQIAAADTNPSGLAAKLGVTHVAVHGWIYGVNAPSPENIRGLARTFRVPVEDVYAALGRIPPSEEDGLTAGGRRLLAILRELPPDYQDAVADAAESVASVLRGRTPEGSPDTEAEAGE